MIQQQQQQQQQQSGYSMSTGGAVVFGGNIYGFFIFPQGGTTDFLGRFFKSIINAIYVSKI
jgi:hypothetical protein